MVVLRVYVENSVISAYYYAEEWMIQVTRQFFEHAKATDSLLYASDVTIAELEKSPEEMRETLLRLIEDRRIMLLARTKESGELAKEYVRRGVIPERYLPDAEHIAIASVHALDALVSWNLAHIVRLRTKRIVKEINKERDYSTPEILRPDEVL